MRDLLIPLFLVALLTSTSCQNEQKQGFAERLKQHRYEQNLYFNNPETSPLKQLDQRNFSRLEFFAPDRTFKTSATLFKNTSPRYIEIPDTKGGVDIYKDLGLLKFELQGKPYQLTLFQYEEDFEKHYFLPFKDSTNGKDTYEGGRYLNIDFKDDPNSNEIGDINLDFNYAYQPYCYYNPDFICPRTPDQNRLELAIKAGEKKQ